MISIAQVNASNNTPAEVPRVINQLQQNIGDAFNKLQIQLTSITSAIGDTQLSTLTLAQFQAQRGKGWVLSNGQTVAGSQYQKITGSPTVPNQVADFPNTHPYIRIN